MPIIKTSQGELKGVLCKTNTVEYLAFKGIPYAKPPTGQLRFTGPEAPEPWQGLRDASQHGPVCPQYNERLDRIEVGSEDCLYLNVYSKSITPACPLPVLVWIHGGGFYTGSGNSDYYGPEFFMHHDIVLVTFNYRLEVLGFLCLDNEDVPGNAGLKDQVAALKWVKHNIFAFGGDFNNITIFGCSAGSASVSYHLVSKMSEGLFNRAICQSGVCLNDWSYNINAKNHAFQLGKILGKETEDPKELLEFLRNVPTSSLVKIQPNKLKVEHRDLIDGFLFGPVIEKSLANVKNFLSEPPPDLVINGNIAKVPIILGYTSAEGIETARQLNNMLDFFSQVGSIVPREIKLKTDKKKVEEIDNKIRLKYFNGKQITKEMLQEVSDLHTYSLFAYNICRFASHCTRFNSCPVYLYKFTAETERNYTKKLYKMSGLKGVCHADDLPYLFNVTSLKIPLTENSKTIIRGIVGLWTAFAQTGNPTDTNCVPTWKPYKDKEKNCYVIGNNFECIDNPDANHITFWEEIYTNVGLV